MTAFPATALYDQFEALIGYLPSVRDGNAEGIHQARVVTRRLRESLPLFSRSYPGDVKRIKRVVRRAGRKLGRVRELDVMDGDLSRRAGRMPLALEAISSARARLSDRRERARRRLIKALDRLHLDRRDRFQLRHRADWWHPFAGPARGWVEELRDRVIRRADELSSAIDHAGGVYFPRRLHTVRVVAKKLRYGMELAGLGGLWQCGEAVANLKRAQDTLGRIRDAEVLLQAMDGLVAEEAGARAIAIVTDDLKGEIAECHAKYLGNREGLRRAAQDCVRAVLTAYSSRRQVRPFIALSAAAAVPAGLYLLGSQSEGSTVAVPRSVRL